MGTRLIFWDPSLSNELVANDTLRPLKKIYMFSVPARFLFGGRLLFFILFFFEIFYFFFGGGIFFWNFFFFERKKT